MQLDQDIITKQEKFDDYMREFCARLPFLIFLFHTSNNHLVMIVEQYLNWIHIACK